MMNNVYGLIKIVKGFIGIMFILVVLAFIAFIALKVRDITHTDYVYVSVVVKVIEVNDQEITVEPVNLLIKPKYTKKKKIDEFSIVLNTDNAGSYYSYFIPKNKKVSEGQLIKFNGLITVNYPFGCPIDREVVRIVKKIPKIIPTL